MGKRIIVIGGGIVGVCSALQLQRDGYQVRLVDPKKPGRETSYGNAGVFAEASFVILNNPGLLKKLPKLLKNRTNGFRFDPLFVLKRLPWFFKFLSYCRRSHMLCAASSLRQLLTLSLDMHKDFIAAAGVEHLLQQSGWLKLFRTEAGFAQFSEELELAKQFDVKFKVYHQEQIRQIEPSLSPIYSKAVLMEDTCSVSSPADLTDAYIALFQAGGGVVEKSRVSGLYQRDSVWHVDCGLSVFAAESVVLSAGAWSAEIASWLGYKIPMVWERGYHMHLAPAETSTLRRPIHDIEAGFVVAPMDRGLRVTSGVEIADRDAPPNYQQINQSVSMFREVCAVKAPIDDRPWMGRRPTLVDSLPMIGAGPRHAGLWFNFGHQHLGLSTAPGSALLLSALMSGTKPPVEATPFKPTRFRL